MPNTSFEFKQFSVKQDRCAMKVGTDAVLLGAWVFPNGAKQILDIGTGSGVIALMLAQKSQAQILGLEMDEASASQAEENFQNSKFHHQLSVKQISFQEFSKQETLKFDLIVTNPPYFQQSFKSSDGSRTNARHADMSLPFEDLISGVKRLLSDKGKFCLILPTTEALIFRELAEKKGLYLSKLLRVKSRTDKDTDKRHLMQFEFKETEFSESSIAIELNERHQYTPEYKFLTKDYYLNF